MTAQLGELRAFNPFTKLPRRDRAMLAQAAEVKAFRPGESIVRADDSCSEMTVMVAGFARLYQIAVDGAETTTGLVAPGNLLTVAPLLESPASGVYAEALGPVRVLAVPATRVRDLGARYPEFAHGLIGCLLRRADDIYADALVTAALSLDERVLHILRALALTRPGGDRTSEMRRLGLRISHAGLARIVQSDRGAVTRAWGELESRGDLCRVRGHVTHIRCARAGFDADQDVVTP